jgi:hypothetical protein
MIANQMARNTEPRPRNAELRPRNTEPSPRNTEQLPSRGTLWVRKEAVPTWSASPLSTGAKS